MGFRSGAPLAYSFLDRWRRTDQARKAEAKTAAINPTASPTLAAVVRLSDGGACDETDGVVSIGDGDCEAD